MRHYFRFMELEPVLEMEEDSVGEESPTSSTGSPSFSPPPDVWGQLTGKEYHDSVYNLLLQDHLELQRAYRVLEVQYRNCEKRAGRDATESAAQVRALKDTLKEVLTTQESDRMIAIKEDLQRVRERETKLKEEAYDLREQNELLEFRILELEECHENSSRSGGYDTCDTATDTGDDDVILDTPLDGTLREQQVIADVSTLVTPDSMLTIGKEPSDVTPNIGEVTCHQATLHNNDGNNMCQQTLESSMASPPGDPQCCTVTAQSAISLEQSTPHAHHNDYRDHMSVAECSSGVVDATCPPDVAATSRPISCTLCRRLPRRKSLTETSADVTGEPQREPLRKCKSDGEMKKWNRCRELEIRDDMEFEVANCSEHGEIVNISNKHKSKDRGVESSLVSCSPNSHIDGMPLNSSEVTHSCNSSSPSNRSTPNEDDQLVVRDMLKSIWDVLKETRIEVECTNSELREEVVTLENTVVCLMGETTSSPDAEEEENKDINVPGNLRELFQRHNSLTSSKECHCCSEAMRPAIEDVICKLQLLTALVDNASLKPNTTPNVPCGEAKTGDAWDNLVADGKTEALKTRHVEIPETPVARTEVQIRKSVSGEGENKLLSRVTEHEGNNIVDNSVVNKDEHTVIEYKDNITIVRNIVEKKREYFKNSKAIFEIDNRTEYHASALHTKVEDTYNVGDAERPKKELNNNILIEIPLSGDKVTTTDRLIYQLEYYHSTDI